MEGGWWTLKQLLWIRPIVLLPCGVEAPCLYFCIVCIKPSGVINQLVCEHCKAALTDRHRWLAGIVFGTISSKAHCILAVRNVRLWWGMQHLLSVETSLNAVHMLCRSGLAWLSSIFMCMGYKLSLQAQFAFKLLRAVRSPALKCILSIIHFAVSKKNSNVPSFTLISVLGSVKFTLTCCYWQHVEKTTLWQFNKNIPRLTVSLAHSCTCFLYMFWAPLAAFIAVCVYVTVMACRQTFWGMVHHSSRLFFSCSLLTFFAGGCLKRWSSFEQLGSQGSGWTNSSKEHKNGDRSTCAWMVGLCLSRFLLFLCLLHLVSLRNVG